MKPATETQQPELGTLGRNLAINVWRRRKQVYPTLSRKRLAELAGIPSESTLETIEAGQDPKQPAPNPELRTVEKLAYGLQQAGVDVSATDLLQTPTPSSGR